MDIAKRQSLLALLALPAGCSLSHLPELPLLPVPSGWQPPAIRPPEIGQSWTYNKFNFHNSQLLDQVTERVVQLDNNSIRLQRQSNRSGNLPDEIHTTWGQVKQDPYWDIPQIYESPLPLWLPSLAMGTQSTTHTRYQSPEASFQYSISAFSRVVSWEKVQLPIGTFETVRIEKLLRLTHPDITKLELLRRDTLWFAPHIGRWVARDMQGQYQMNQKRNGLGLEEHVRWELAQLGA